MHASARAFQAEENVSTDPVAIDVPSGFLFEWWSVFWDIYIARTDKKYSEAAAIYSKIEVKKHMRCARPNKVRLENCKKSRARASESKSETNAALYAEICSAAGTRAAVIGATAAAA
ncbi:hypothetical protein HN51_061702 [Arachis hypogaea]